MDFEFLEYLAANPSLSFEEIREVDRAAYKRLDGSYEGVIEGPPAATIAAQARYPSTESPAESVSDVENGGGESNEQTTITPTNTPEAETLMKEIEILTGRSWDPNNTQGFSMLK